MKKRPDGFLAEGNIDHNSEIFDYIKELHTEMWKIIDYHNCKISNQLDVCWEFLMNKLKVRKVKIEKKRRKKEIEFELKGKARFYATDIVDAFKKLAEHFSNLARYCEDKKAGNSLGILGPGTDISIEPVKNKEK